MFQLPFQRIAGMLKPAKPSSMPAAIASFYITLVKFYIHNFFLFLKCSFLQWIGATIHMSYFYQYRQSLT